jgi:hypothetical protein
MLVDVVADRNERCGITRGFEGLSDNQRDRLAIEQDAV